MPFAFSRRTGLAAPMLLIASSAPAQEWRPTQTIRIISPAGPGGLTDIAARLLAQHLQARYGSAAVVENKPGGGGTVGSNEVARAAADGHTILSGSIGPQAIAYSLFRNLPYRPVDFTPLSNIFLGPNILVLHPSVPAGSVPEFVAHLKQNPGAVPYGSSGVGASTHLCGVWFNQITGTQSIHIPYRGAGPAMAGLLAGDVKFMFDNIPTSIENVRTGRLKALAVTSAARIGQMPELPALRETMLELARFDVSAWVGMFLPARTPPPAVAWLNGAIRSLLEQPETVARFQQLGGVPAYDTAERFAAFVVAEIQKWRGVIQQEGLQIDIT
jgi:tripartite-type tricarboxylate transporter receptor subunit TctC